MGLVGGPSTTILNQWVAYVQHISDFCEYSTSRLRCPAILSKTFLIGLIAFNPREDPLAQATVPCDDLVSHLHII